MDYSKEIDFYEEFSDPILANYKPIAMYRVDPDMINKDQHYYKFYLTHVDEMTRQDLHSKADIANELAYRDRVIYELMRRLDILPEINQS